MNNSRTFLKGAGALGGACNAMVRLISEVVPDGLVLNYHLVHPTALVLKYRLVDTGPTAEDFRKAVLRNIQCHVRFSIFNELTTVH